MDNDLFSINKLFAGGTTLLSLLYDGGPFGGNSDEVQVVSM